ncbi:MULTISPECIES: hypothetical protein [unclassified Nostoc]|uniref:hypothetical protein n=1 Tax=unclassified Nostoc TaxID=2593658 RepID=UPI002AD20A49|nr:hypothetical protein [Nostoc sp. DedQUE03]MDZ7974456.1 hypothetical protein [Nostoc sp. DedQUE03]MDZ8047141.1 hypothetical protein [Nostoc sp. DedQUE02]
MYDGIAGDRLAENLKYNAIVCCVRVCDRFAENLKYKAIADCMMALQAIALQKTSNIKRSSVVKKLVQSHLILSIRQTLSAVLVQELDSLIQFLL